MSEFGKKNRSISTYDKYFEKEGLRWVLCGRATLRIPERANESGMDEGADTLASKKRKRLRRDVQLEHVLIFLDDFFQNKDIDRDPTRKSVYYTKLSWLDIYDQYEDFCKKDGTQPVRYDKFCSIRYGQEHRQLRKCLILPPYL